MLRVHVNGKGQCRDITVLEYKSGLPLGCVGLGCCHRIYDAIQMCSPNSPFSQLGKYMNDPIFSEIVIHVCICRLNLHNVFKI